MKLLKSTDGGIYGQIGPSISNIFLSRVDNLCLLPDIAFNISMKMWSYRFLIMLIVCFMGVI